MEQKTLDLLDELWQSHDRMCMRFEAQDDESSRRKSQVLDDPEYRYHYDAFTALIMRMYPRG